MAAQPPRSKKKPRHDLTGKRYGRLLVVSLVDSEAGANIPTKWLCLCDCGNKKEVLGYNLKNGNTRSCGCAQKEYAVNRSRTHGLTGTRLYHIWQHSIGRCCRKSNRAYKWYGGRGIKVCDEWLHNFQAFYDWAMENGYQDNLTLDRIDVNGNYCPENCRWITLEEQQRNKRNNVSVEFDGQIKKLCEWAEIFGCKPQRVYQEILTREGRVKTCDRESK